MSALSCLCLLPRCFHIFGTRQDPHATGPRNAGLSLFLSFSSSSSSDFLGVGIECGHVATARQGVVFGGQSEENPQIVQLRRRPSCWHVRITSSTFPSSSLSRKKDTVQALLSSNKCFLSINSVYWKKGERERELTGKEFDRYISGSKSEQSQHYGSTQPKSQPEKETLPLEVRRQCDTLTCDESH